MKLFRFLPLCLLFGFCPAQAQQVDETDLTSDDVLSLINADAWAFSYKPKIPTKSLHLLVYEELTDEKGKTTTSIRKAMWMGMRPNPDRVFKIMMILKDRELNSRISAAVARPSISPNTSSTAPTSTDLTAPTSPTPTDDDS